MSTFNVRTVRKLIALDKLVSSDAVNVRDPQTYDIETMIDQVRAKGGITTPLTVEPIADRKGYYLTLRGNRRQRAALWLLAHPDTPQSLKDALSKLECDVIDEPISDKTRLSIILDHGESKGLTRLETVKAVWRLDAQMYSESQIGEMMYYQLAEYSGNKKKLAALAALKDAQKRREFLTTWLRGTLGRKILLANRLGEYVREQFILTTMAEDGPLPAGVTVEMPLDQPRLGKLQTARDADAKTGGWDPVKGGETFNVLIQNFKDETAGRKDKEKNERPSAAKLKEQATQVYKSAPIRAALLTAAGENSAGAGLVEMDKAIYRFSLVTEILTAHIGKVTPEVSALLKALIGDGPAADVEAALAPFLAPSV